MRTAAGTIPQAAAGAGSTSTFTSCVRLSVTRVASSPHTAANDIHAPGIALVAVAWMSQVAINGVNPPKIAVRTEEATGSREARTSGCRTYREKGSTAAAPQPETRQRLKLT